MEEMINDDLAILLIPAESMTTEKRQFLFKAGTQAHKQEWLRAFMVVVTGKGFLRGLSTHLNSFKAMRPDLMLTDDD